MCDESAGNGEVLDEATGDTERNPSETRLPYASPGPNGWKRTCGAKTRSGTPCKRPPITGRTRCRLHGGATAFGMAHYNWKHGRRSKYLGWLMKHMPELPPSAEDG